MYITDLPEANGVKFGNLFLKPNDIVSTIARSCRMVLWEATEPESPMGRSGTSTLISYRCKKYVVLTRHELGIKSNQEPTKDLLDTVMIVAGDRQLKNIPLKKCYFESSNPEKEFHDLLFFEVETELGNQDMDAPYFIPVDQFSNKERIESYIVGCPLNSEVMSDYLEKFGSAETGSINAQTAVASCTYHRSASHQLNHLRHYIGGPIECDLNGFSGGAVFSVIKDAVSFEIVLDGIVVRGGNSNIYVVDSDYIVKALKKVVRHP